VGSDGSMTTALDTAMARVKAQQETHGVLQPKLEEAERIISSFEQESKDKNYAKKKELYNATRFLGKSSTQLKDEAGEGMSKDDAKRIKDLYIRQQTLIKQINNYTFDTEQQRLKARADGAPRSAGYFPSI